MGITHHDGISVYGSGLYVGKKNIEYGPIIAGSGYITSAWVTGSSLLDSAITSPKIATNAVTSGKIASGAVLLQSLAANLRTDAGTFGISGWSKTGMSTYLTSINYANAQPVLNTSNVGGLMTLASGYISKVMCNWSGGALDFVMLAVMSGIQDVYTSGGTSSKIGWFAIGT